jgi:hypothetical protein
MSSQPITTTAPASNAEILKRPKRCLIVMKALAELFHHNQTWVQKFGMTHVLL